ncbi:MAG: UvrD-helicase domain-containing protein [candidate division WOR-3 bacterium]|nr:MAG: UvrD-helicase domain-containing protein [candidate division WOR-3 bacterium]
MSERINNIALVSAAGAGKTRALTRRFLSLFLDKAAYPLDSLYGITFTNEAAFEMKERIIGYLDLLISGKPHDESDEDILKFFRDRIPDVQKLARQRKQYLLENLSELHVSTFHSLFASFLSSIPFIAGIIPGYQIIDETEESIIFDRVLEAFFEDVHKDKSVSAILSALLEQQETSLKYSLPNLFRSLVPWLDFLEHLIAAEKTVDQTFIEENRVFKESLREFTDFIKIHEAYGRTKTTGAMNKNLAGFIAKLDDFISTDDEENLHKTIFGIDIAEKSYIHSFLARAGSHAGEMTTLISRLQEHTKRYLAARSDQQILIHLKPIMELVKRFKKEKLHQNVISFEDIEQYALQALRQTAETEYLYFKIGSEIRHMMIDEFQDTSFRQIQILEPLLSEITSVDPRVKSLFYVGDPFQAIYRWRGGSPALFDLLKNKYAGKIEKEELNTNYRTTEEIIEFVNTVLDKHDRVKPGNTGGWVRVEHCGVFGDRETGDAHIRDRVCSIIKELHDDKGFGYSDIAILVRTNAKGVELAQALAERHIPHVSTSRAVIINNRDVRFILHVLEFLNDPENDFALMHVLLSPAFNIKEETLFHLKGKKPTLFLALHDLHPDWHATLKLQRLLDMVYFCDPYQLIYRICTDLGLTLSYALATLLDCAHKRAAEGYDTLDTFLDWIKKAGASIEIREVHPEGVKILTVHKAKGLEFEVVLIPETYWELPSRENNRLLFSYSGDVQPDKLYWRFYGQYFEELKDSEKQRIRCDELNSLYVALTRAKCGIYVLGYETRRGSGFWFDVIEKKTGTKQYSSGIVKEQAAVREEKRRTETMRSISRTPERDMVREERTIYSPTERGIEIIAPTRRERIEFGTIVHDALSAIEWLDEVDTADAIKEIVARTVRVHGRTLEHQEKLAAQLRRILDATLMDSDLRFIFCKDDRDIDFKNEVPIYFEDKQQDIAGVVDRLLVSRDCVIIVDYKTGEEKPEYNTQMRIYKSGVKKIFPKKDLKAYLVYLESKPGTKLVEL